VQSQDTSLTGEREESKYRIERDGLPVLLDALRTHLPVHRYRGEGENALPDAQHYISTIYFDTPSLALFRAAKDDPTHNAKLRAREYYDLHSSLAELATDPDQIVRYQPWLWLELKRRDGDHTFKERVRVEKASLSAFLAELSGPCSDPDGGSSAQRAMRALCSALGEPISASLLVHYRRLAFQDDQGTLRVTLDDELSYYVPPQDLWTRRRARVRAYLGLPASTESFCLLEVKRRGALPTWLEATLEACGAQRVTFSKFPRAGAVIHDGA
jgi:hypothetical protein